MAVRELRQVIVSSLRFNARRRRIPESEYINRDAFIRTIKRMVKIADDCASMLDYTRLIRFEELVSGDREKIAASLASIRAVTGCSEEEVHAAVQKAHGKSTMTFSGSRTSLDGYWTPEIEEIFLAEGGDRVNRLLGYEG